MASLLAARGERGDGVPVYELLSAADRVASAGMWLVVHETYACTVYLAGRDLGPGDFKPGPEGHTGGSLNVVPACTGYMAINALTGVTCDWLMGQGHCVAAIDSVNLLLGNMTGAHAVEAAAGLLGIDRADLLSEDELAALDRRASPAGVITGREPRVGPSPGQAVFAKPPCYRRPGPLCPGTRLRQDRPAPRVSSLRPVPIGPPNPWGPEGATTGGRKGPAGFGAFARLLGSQSSAMNGSARDFANRARCPETGVRVITPDRGYDYFTRGIEMLSLTTRPRWCQRIPETGP